MYFLNFIIKNLKWDIKQFDWYDIQLGYRDRTGKSDNMIREILATK